MLAALRLYGEDNNILDISILYRTVRSFMTYHTLILFCHPPRSIAPAPTCSICKGCVGHAGAADSAEAMLEISQKPDSQCSVFSFSTIGAVPGISISTCQTRLLYKEIRSMDMLSRLA